MNLLVAKIKHLGPCQVACDWLSNYTDPQKAWDECRRPMWMTWLIRMVDREIATPDSPSFQKYAAFRKEYNPVFFSTESDDLVEWRKTVTDVIRKHYPTPPEIPAPAAFQAD